MKSEETLISKDGVRLDGRKPNELRPTSLEVGLLGNADGSAYVEQGKNKLGDKWNLWQTLKSCHRN